MPKHSSALLQAPDTDLYGVQCAGEIALLSFEAKLRFETCCRFQTVGQKLFVGVLDADMPWRHDQHRGFGIGIDTEDGTVTDLVNDLGVIEYLDSAPLRPGTEIPIVVEVEKQNRVMLAQIRVGSESFLHPALHLEGVERLGAFVGTTLLWGGSAGFGASRFELVTTDLRSLYA